MLDFELSFTGADDKTDIKELLSVSKRSSINIEFGILYFPEREGTQRNPSPEWRALFLKQGLRSAAHLCGKQVFEKLLLKNEQKHILSDLSFYDRVQVNINAKHEHFSDREVLDIYKILIDYGCNPILQYNNKTSNLILKFINSLSQNELSSVGILIDGSKGTGQLPEQWEYPAIKNSSFVKIGFAGGLSPENISDELIKIKKLPHYSQQSFWLDMESGIRSNNELDIIKIRQVIESCSFLYRHP